MALLPDLLPSLADIPMGLGDHLQDLKRRLFWPVVVLCVAFFLGVVFQNDLKKLLVWPLMHAIDIVGVERAKSIGLEVGTARFLELDRHPQAGEPGADDHCFVLFDRHLTCPLV